MSLRYRLAAIEPLILDVRGLQCGRSLVAGRDVSQVMSLSARRRGRWRRTAVSSVAVSLVGGLLVALPPVPVPASAGVGDGSADKSVPVSPVPVEVSSPTPMPDWQGTDAVWPTAASTVLALPADLSGDRSGIATVGGLPVLVS